MADTVVPFRVPSREGQALLTRYKSFGFRLLFFDGNTKGPSGAEGTGWKKRDEMPEDYREEQNVGVFTGIEVAPGRFLADVDFDNQQILVLAKRLLPVTPFGYTRDDRTLTHGFYYTAEPIVSTEFNDPITKRPLVELRGISAEGDNGHQTMVPPSKHPTGGILFFPTALLNSEGLPEPPAFAPDLSRRVTLYAIGGLFYLYLGTRGLLHDVRLGMAAFLLDNGLSEDEVISLGEAVAEATGNDVSDVRPTVESTAKRIRNGDKVKQADFKDALGEHAKPILRQVKEWLGCEDFTRDDKDRLRANDQDNIALALAKLDVTLSYNAFTNKPCVQRGADRRRVLEDYLVNELWLAIDKTFLLKPEKRYFDIVLGTLARRNSFHPVLDYLAKLTWDGVPRVDEWLVKGGKAADTGYVRAVSRLVLIAAVRRARNYANETGIKFDEMLVLESGTQGFFKSTAIRTLCEDETWFSDDLPLNVDTKQVIERTQGKWIIEASDLSGMRASQVEQLKALLSRQTDGPVRLAYAHHASECPRQFVIIGTTNSYNYLLDSTGNRRFWPVRVEQFDIKWLRENRDQLWAEAAVREARGEKMRLPESLYEHASFQQERRRVTDPWEETLGKHFDESYYRLTPDNVWERLNIPIERRDARATKRVGDVMQKLGFRKCTVHDPETQKKVKGWAKGTEGLGIEPEDEGG